MNHLQQLFDRISTHLLTQGCRSELGDTCRYRGPEGTMCAIGCLIDDAHYAPHLENQPSDTKPVRDAVEGSLGIVLERWEVAALVALQGIHDESSPEEWPDHLRQFANNYNLTFNEEKN